MDHVTLEDEGQVPLRVHHSCPCVEHGVWHTVPKTAPVQVNLSYFVPLGLGCLIFKGKKFGGVLSSLRKPILCTPPESECEHRWGKQLLARCASMASRWDPRPDRHPPHQLTLSPSRGVIPRSPARPRFCTPPRTHTQTSLQEPRASEAPC